MFCWLVMPLPKLVSIARLTLSSLILWDGVCRQKNVYRGREEAADFISLHSA